MSHEKSPIFRYVILVKQIINGNLFELNIVATRLSYNLMVNIENQINYIFIQISIRNDLVCENIVDLHNSNSGESKQIPKELFSR